MIMMNVRTMNVEQVYCSILADEIPKMGRRPSGNDFMHIYNNQKKKKCVERKRNESLDYRKEIILLFYSFRLMRKFKTVIMHNAMQ